VRFSISPWESFFSSRIAWMRSPQGERQRVKGSGGQSCNHERGQKQAVTMNQRQEKANQSERDRGDPRNAAGAEQTAEIHGERPNEHERDVIRAANPGTIVKADPETPLKVGSAQRERAPGQRDDSRAQYHAQNAQAGFERAPQAALRLWRAPFAAWKADGRLLPGKPWCAPLSAWCVR
jgi:hypothetical protein